MKVWIYSLVFAVSSLAVSSQTCPSNHFSAIFVATVDQVFDERIGAVFDPEFTFFRDVLKYRDEDIRHAAEDAFRFFNETYGLDFSTAPPNPQHQLTLGNAQLNPFFLSKEIKYTVTSNNWIRTGSTRSSCYTLDDGGFRVHFLGDQTLYGSYGGPEGKPAGMGNVLAYGFFSINVCQQSPVLLQFQTATPLRPEPIDGINVINQDIYNHVLGYGKGQGVVYYQPEPNGKVRLVIRNAITFPA